MWLEEEEEGDDFDYDDLDPSAVEDMEENTWSSTNPNPALPQWRTEVEVEVEAPGHSSTRFTLTSSAPAGHSYLGLTRSLVGPPSGVSGMVNEGESLILPLIVLQNVVLFPMEKLPMRVLSSQARQVLRHVLASNCKRLGVLETSHLTSSGVGTTVDIQHLCLDATSPSMVGLGRQRFRLQSYRWDESGLLIGLVQICHELHATPLPLAVSNHQQLAYWQPWVYRRFHGAQLVRECQRMLQTSSWASFECLELGNVDEHNDEVEEKNPETNEEDVSKLRHKMLHKLQDPTLFSYWLAANLPLDIVQRQNLLEIDCTVQRLRRLLIEIGNHCEVLCCTGCGFAMSQRSHIFPASDVGSVGTFVNSGGSVHQMATFLQVNESNLVLDACPPSTQDSWFPGYAWTIAYCRECFNHMGWKFQAVEDRLRPIVFWGIRSSAIESMSRE